MYTHTCAPTDALVCTHTYPTGNTEPQQIRKQETGCLPFGGNQPPPHPTHAHPYNQTHIPMVEALSIKLSNKEFCR